MDLGLKGKVAIVTGGAVGLGRAISLGFAQEGASVAVVDLQEEKAIATAEDAKKLGVDAIAIKCNVAKNEEVKAMVDKVLKHFGKIDILVNDAAIAGPQGPWIDITDEGFDSTIAVNCKAALYCSNAVTAHMVGRGSGHIVNIGSCAGTTGEGNNGIYSASKAFIINFTHSLAQELGKKGVIVNCVSPAGMMTDMTSAAWAIRAKSFGITVEQMTKQMLEQIWTTRPIKVEDTAGLVLWAASERGEMACGSILNITAGREVHA
jgi:NAD(P)-dependent dehydrogenase (short-subunit alcohol dehydrogenase family)